MQVAIEVQQDRISKAWRVASVRENWAMNIFRQETPVNRPLAEPSNLNSELAVCWASLPL
jgi:hypothetical protein